MTGIALPALLAAVFGGACIAFQAPINAALGRMLGDPLVAAAVSFGVGFFALAFGALLRAGAPSASAMAGLPWWALAGGLCGAVYVCASMWAVPRIGALSVAAAIVLGQMMAAMALDAAGAFGLTPEPVTLKRVAAAALVAAGVLLSRG